MLLADRLKYFQSAISKIYPFLILILLFSGPEKIQFAIPFIILIFRVFQNKLNIYSCAKKIYKEQSFIKLITALFVYQCANYTWSLFTKKTDALSFLLFIVSFYVPMVFLFLVTEDNWFFIKKSLKTIILIQAFLVLGYGLFYRGNITQAGDWARGTVLWAYWLGFCIVWFMWDSFWKEKMNTGRFLSLALLIFVLYLTESKTVIIISIISLLVTGSVIFFSSHSFKKMLKIGGFAAILLLVLAFNMGASILSFYIKTKHKPDLLKNIKETERYINKTYKNDLSTIYIEGDLNHKFLFIKRGWEYLLKNHLILIGTSPGTLGSRAANLRAQDVLFKPDGAQAPFLATYSSPATREVYAGLYTPEYFKQAANYSSVLSMPFSGLFSFFFENGIIGLLILLLTVLALIRIYYPSSPGAIFLLIIIFLWGIFDTIWERPFIMGFFYLILRINYLEAKSKSPKKSQ